ncbi:uncharacterized protein LOC131671800 [Phymastichus coffea]|uniref:uncharacterized protein LOC131671800 n=1 Tax=Phymastichus coffea TaxID=108790 RepID=UPI00273BAC6D|nr:uncharacterized protein LOC131671800 [Phymastichus coffea]
MQKREDSPDSEDSTNNSEPGMMSNVGKYPWESGQTSVGPRGKYSEANSWESGQMDADPRNTKQQEAMTVGPEESFDNSGRRTPKGPIGPWEPGGMNTGTKVKTVTFADSEDSKNNSESNANPQREEDTQLCGPADCSGTTTSFDAGLTDRPDASETDQYGATNTPGTLSVKSAHCDNRLFIPIAIGKVVYDALIDSGASVSIIGPSITARYRDRLIPRFSEVQGVTGVIERTEGELPLQVSCDGHTARFNFKAMTNLTGPPIILGLDFLTEWDMVLLFKDKKWRVRGGRWHYLRPRKPHDIVTFSAECAGLIEMTTAQAAKLNEVIERLPPPETDELGRTPVVKHLIDIGDSKPVRQGLRRMSPAMQKIVREEIKRMYDLGIIRPSKSAWRSASVMIRKPDGTWRFCIDYRDLNKVTRKDAYPLPNMDSILDRLRHIALEEDSCQYTAFASPGEGLWEFVVMPFGLVNAPATFQRLADALFGPDWEPYVFPYLDDIIIATESFDDHLHFLELVLRRLNDAGLQINAKKCEFGCSRLNYLGLLLDHDGL